tara:strand:+ start:11457 stop:13163 length:1707 start_codon:yes stop_codon:yes gene_type:complete
MSDFIVSARKYRPTTFDSLVGQSSITITLKNAVKLNQLAQSFLFCGPRGVGKTSCARILAKTINCESISEKIEACNICTSCKSFNENASFNVHELDAASNNSVDDIRKLVDQVRFAPQVGDYNIYIIDEVHMLSASAFNAFLKTLEEPPKHAKFILATTEKHKIIPTILSRCQIFDFKRVSVDDIVSHLDFVAKSEGVIVEQEALHLIAQKSDGAMRDSLTLFDRLVSFSEKSLTYKEVIIHLNILDYDYYFKVADLFLLNDVHNLLNIFNEILANGFDGHHFINGLADHLRNLLVSNDESTVKLLDKGNDLQNRYLEQSKKYELDFLLNALKLCNECDIQYQTTNNQRLLVELTLIRIASINFQVEKKKSKSFVVTVNDRNREVSVEKADEIIQERSSVIESKVEKPHVKINLESKKSSLISINSSFKDDQEIVDQQTSNLELRDTNFSINTLISVWEELIIFFRQKGKSNISIALDGYKPKLIESNIIDISLSNTAQREMILEEKYMILDYLRNRLENDLIEIRTNILEGDKSKIPYTNKDKFNKMLEENPQLETLRVKLGLDPDY